MSIEGVDNWHRRWKDVTRLIERCGAGASLRLDAGGWLSARQIVCAAFAGDRVAAFVCFHIEPDAKGCIFAQVDAFAIDRPFAGRGIEKRLREFARKRAKKLRCSRLSGFELPDDWSIA
jgi:GNAT superfamily N-acetyltransferase